MIVRTLTAAFLAGAAIPALAESRTVLLGPMPAWVLPPPQPTAEPTPADAAFRFVYNDTQLMIAPDGESQYAAYRVKLLKPEALSFGNVNVVWSPENGDATVHLLRIWRGGNAIDMLKSAKFSVLQRENGLEMATLDGLLTAALQIPGLQLGDELELAVTVRRRDPVLGPRAMGLAQLPVQGLPGAFRVRLTWPAATNLTVRGTRDLPPLVPVTDAGRKVATVELRDPTSAIPTEGAPARYNLRRRIDYSSFASWSEVSNLFWPLYQQASAIAPVSPLRAEIGRIKAANSDPAARAMAALRLVQDQVRYVFVGLNDGNYRPATADQTWQRRYGDCKAKTALLLGLLRELGIEAEAVVVNSDGDNAADQRLPSPGAFNHILVRAKIGVKPVWLDGTRLGDRYLDRLPQPGFRWALPLSRDTVALEAVPPVGPARPQYIAVVDVDSTAGLTVPAKVTVTHILHDDEAFVLRTKLASLSAADVDRGLRSYWREQEGWIDADRVSWNYDERGGTLTMSVTGTGKPDWKGETDARYLSLWGAGFVAPDMLRRPKDQDQSAPWQTEFPRWRCWSTTLHLPKMPPKLGWKLYAEPMNATIGGVRYWRASSLTGDVARTVMSRRIIAPEISAADAAQNNAAITTFNNNMSTVEQSETGAAKAAPAIKRAPPFADDADWTGNAPACAPPN